jgi:F-type H+-transporting ATPase subunit epsilon
MADLLHLEVATPERSLVREDVSEVQVPGKDGYLGVLPGHAPLLGQLGAGFLSYQTGGGRKFLSVAGGFVEIKDDHVRILADVAERAEEIDVERARRALERAQQELLSSSGGVDPAEALWAAARAQARIETAALK